MFVKLVVQSFFGGISAGVQAHACRSPSCRFFMEVCPYLHVTDHTHHLSPCFSFGTLSFKDLSKTLFQLASDSTYQWTHFFAIAGLARCHFRSTVSLDRCRNESLPTLQ
jgi:hypothetical protein